MFRYPHIAARIFGAPLLMRRAGLETMIGAFEPILREGGPLRSAAAAPAATMGPADGGVPRKPYAVTPDGIAVIAVEGVLVRRAGQIDADCTMLRSYEALGAEMMDAATDPAVKAILLDVDSDGGEAGGCMDLSDLIYQARETKPVWAVANEQCYSAAYAIASAAEKIYLPRTGGLGSIGVVAMHIDQSGFDAKIGARYTYLFAGERKIDGNPHQPLSEPAALAFQAEIDRLYGLFVYTVARNRGLAAEAVMATEAACYFGPDAIAAGLADAEGTFAEALVDLSAALAATAKPAFTLRRAPGASTRKAAKESSMSETNEPNPKPGEEKPKTETETAEPNKTTESTETTQAPPSNVVALASARPTTVAEAQALHLAIVEACAVAGRPQLAGGFIKAGATLDTVRAALAAQAVAEAEATRIDTAQRAGQSQPAALIDTAAIYAARNRQPSRT